MQSAVFLFSFFYRFRTLRYKYKMNVNDTSGVQMFDFFFRIFRRFSGIFSE